MTVVAPRVLVIDDDTMQIELVDRALSRDGFEVRGVSEPSAIEREAKSFAPDIVLLDVNMPGSSNEDALALARSASPSGTRFVLYSASDATKLRALAKAQNADGWISKSDSVFEIARRLKELHAKREPQ